MANKAALSPKNQGTNLCPHRPKNLLRAGPEPRIAEGSHHVNGETTRAESLKGRVGRRASDDANNNLSIDRGGTGYLPYLL